MSTTNNPIELTILELTGNGNGIAKHDNKVYFVDDTAPGDIIIPTKSVDKKSFALVEEFEFKSKSTDRQTPPCSHHKECGGCNWMHVKPNVQMQQKTKILQNSLQKIAKLSTPIPEINSVVTESNTWRNRLRIHVERENLMTEVGFYRKNSKEIVQIEHCMICHPLINDFLEWTINNIDQLKIQDGDKLDLQIDLIKNNEGKSELNVYPQRIKSLGHIDLSKKKLLTKRVVDFIKLSKPEMKIPITYKPQGFMQSNQDINSKIKKILKDIVPTSARTLELYSGSGNFTSILASKTEKIIAVEEDLKNKPKNRDNIEFKSKRVEQFIENAINQSHKYETVFLNPPRVGAKSIASSLVQLDPKTILYLSCDSATLARDIAMINESSESPWTIQQLNLFDMFPHTHHFETLVVLTNENNVS